MELVNSTITRGSRCSLGREISPIPFFSKRRRVLRQKVALVIDEEHFGVGEERFVLPRAFELRDFFFERHAREEIGDALLDRQCGVAIGQRGLLRVAPCAISTQNLLRQPTRLRGTRKIGRKSALEPPFKISMLAIQNLRGTIPRPLTYTARDFCGYFARCRGAWQGAPRFSGFRTLR